MLFSTDHWPRLVQDEKEVPVSFKNFFAQIYTSETPFPYTLFTLPDKWGNSKLIAFFNDRIYIAEKIKKRIKTTCFLFHQINYIETGTLLLFSWMKIQGMVNGQLTSITVEFNTVAEELFKPIIEKIRLIIHHIEPSENSIILLQKERQKFDYLVCENYKYMNFGRRSLLPDCKVYQILLQPDIKVKFMKYFMRTLSVVHQTILTDKELIIIKDDDSIKKAQQIRYGGIWRFIPLHKINKIELVGNLEENLYSLIIHLPGEVTISSLFSAAQKPKLESLQYGFEQAKFIPAEAKCV